MDTAQLVDVSQTAAKPTGRPRRGDRRPIGMYLPIELRHLMQRAAEARGLRVVGDYVAEIACMAHGLDIPDYIERDRVRPETTDDSLFDPATATSPGRITAPQGLRYTEGMVNMLVRVPVEADAAIRRTAERDGCSISQHVISLLTDELQAPPVVTNNGRVGRRRTDGGQLAMGA